MTPTTTANLAVVPRGSATPAAIEALANAVNAEVRLLEDLIGVMRKQRSSVADDDLQGVDDSVFATHRILVTLGEARRQRRSLGRLIAGTEDLGLRTLEEVLGDRMTDDLRDARDGLRAAALTLSREVETNRRVLRNALSTGGELMRSLYGPPEQENVYHRDSRPPEGESHGGLLIDRQV
ncbi:MAG: flagellar export chaperone FlgN [Gemmatimonadota bacterium]